MSKLDFGITSDWKPEGKISKYEVNSMSDVMD